MKCPECGTEMENGVVSAPGLGMVWSDKPIKILASGEAITEMSAKGFSDLQHMDGYRCTACKLIITHYVEDEVKFGVGESVYEKFYH